MLLGGALLLLASAGYVAISGLGPFVYAVRALDGVSATLLYGSLFTFAADVVPEARRTQGLALFGVTGLIALGVAGALGDFLVASYGYRVLFATVLGLGAVGVGLCVPLRDVHHGAVHAALEPLPTGAPGPVRPLLAKSVLRQRDLVPIWVGSAAFFFAMSAVQAFLKTFVLATGLGSVGVFFAAYSGVALVLRVAFGWVPDRIGLRRMVLPAMAAYALGMVALAGARGTPGVLVSGLLAGIGHACAYPVYCSLVIARAHPAQRGAAMAIYISVEWAAMLAAGPLLGAQIERAGYGAAFITLAAVLAFGTAAFYALDRQRAS